MAESKVKFTTETLRNENASAENVTSTLDDFTDKFGAIQLSSVDETPTESLQVKLFTRYSPNGFAVVCIDSRRVVVAMNFGWFWLPLSEGWEAKVISTLNSYRVSDVYCTGSYETLKKLAPIYMNFNMEFDNSPLRYACKMCGERCAFTKAHLTFRKIYKRQPCDMIHWRDFE
ncbi:hypothetical protein HNY73_011652 [Argiope bruennichi]|uniref:Uncharacterized protein n=1 Tax=Argiope bruennichi TaxID=94029 RepID=A0A8T0F546_ARGBR|nr:hypothetical protein HNY73_011652 [Argiope bruennichi]